MSRRHYITQLRSATCKQSSECNYQWIACAFRHLNLDLNDSQEIGSLEAAIFLKVAKDTRQFTLMHHIETVHHLTSWFLYTEKQEPANLY